MATVTVTRNDIKTIGLRIIILAALGSIIGAVVSLLALSFVEAVLWLNRNLLISPSARIQHSEDTLFLNIATVLVPTLGGLAVGLIVRYMIRVRRGLGPSDSIWMAQTHSTGESTRDGLMSTLAAIVSLGTGASAGQYGPLVYLGTIVGAVAAKLNIDIRNLQAISIASGVAAAISVAFNAPIAGLVFAHEVILRHYSIQVFAPTAVAAAVGYVVANVMFNRPALFLVQFEGIQFGYEFVFFALIGVLSAIVAIVYAKGILACNDLIKRTDIPIQFRPMIAGIILGLVAIWIPDVLGIGSTTLRFATIDHAFGLGELTLLIIAKIVLTSICLGFGFVGGVFSPILLIGILFGALCGGILDDFTAIGHSGIIPYAVCGMMAAASPIIGAPLATILIVFELTRNYDLAIAVMVAVVFSNLISYRLFGRSFFDIQLRQRGFDLSLGRTNALTVYQKVSDLMHENFLRLRPDETVAAVREKLDHSWYDEGIVADENGVFVGIVQAKTLGNYTPECLINDTIEHNPLVFTELTNMREAVEDFKTFTADIAPVVSSTDRKLLGVVWDYDVIRSYLATIQRLRQEENESL
ncbi:MAG: chloride channel protein [Acidiferrobacterales bacterium]|nr:chloride channel protein [Acidiferrobacterales bacterium]